MPHLSEHATLRAHAASNAAARAAIDDTLRSVRSSLGMEIGFVSQFEGDDRVVRHVDAAGKRAPIAVGQRIPLSEGYCQKVVDGRLPELIPDTRLVPAAMEIPETSSLPIGSHMSVPITQDDGSVYGTFCVFSSKPNPSLADRDLRMMRTIADLLGTHLAAASEAEGKTTKFQRIRSAISSGEPHIVYQPVVRLGNMSIVGAEALSRFVNPPTRPDLWFEEAAEAGLQADLEMAAISNAIAGFSDRWASDPGSHLAVNVSARTLLEARVEGVLAGSPAGNMIIEITEHEEVGDYAQLVRAIEPLRARGAKIAIDDAGSGYSSLHHVLTLAPDIIKLDMKLIRGIDTDTARQAMAAALLEFAERTNSELVAEGIETPSELSVLRAMGMHMGQGYLLGRPGPFGALPR